jgi:hypothetical protein
MVIMSELHIVFSPSFFGFSSAGAGFFEIVSHMRDLKITLFLLSWNWRDLPFRIIKKAE